MSTSELLPNPSKRDWKRILHGLASIGITYAEVAAKCNRNPSTVANWASGGDPKDTDARIVLALYARHLPEDFLQDQAEFGVRPPSISPSGEPSSEP